MSINVSSDVVLNHGKMEMCGGCIFMQLNVDLSKSETPGDYANVQLSLQYNGVEYPVSQSLTEVLFSATPPNMTTVVLASWFKSLISGAPQAFTQMVTVPKSWGAITIDVILNNPAQIVGKASGLFSAIGQ
jgi:hypothetical protein